MAISTHTLTWSVTWVLQVQQLQTIYFNSHAHVERDKEFEQAYKDVKNFNSHAHVERDENLKSCYAYSIISTHTLTWSVTATITCRTAL